MKRILLLYSEFMPYTQAVFEQLAINYRITVIYWDLNNLTPFVPKAQSIVFIKRSQFNVKSLKEYAIGFQPSIVIASGRMDPVYLAVCLWLKRLKSVPLVMGCDNQWKGTLKDHIASFFSFFLYRRYFNYAWVPGIRQYEYVRRMGFKSENILLDLYSGNIDLFNQVFLEKKGSLGEDILFIGRLNTIKGVLGLIRVVERLKQEELFSGKLLIFGNGPLSKSLPPFDWIEQKGFADQGHFKEAIIRARLFCLPSVEEPWGVVLHEMAASGLPICCSDACGAAPYFVKDGFNGFVFRAHDWNNLFFNLRKMLALPQDKIREMGRNSNSLAQFISPATSASSIASLVKE